MSSAPAMMTECRDPLQLELYAPLVNSEFSVLRGDERVSLRLIEARALARHKPVEREVFSLLFTGGHDKPLQQGIHEFGHPSLGEFELFITNVIPKDSAHRYYEALVNRDAGW